jgi:hypothetical protein
MKNVLNKVKDTSNKFLKSKRGDKLLKVGQTLCVASLVLGTVALGEPSVDAFTALIADWASKIGGIVAFVGGIDFAMGWKNDDPSERIRGMKTFIAGAMIFAIAKGYSMFM